MPPACSRVSRTAALGALFAAIALGVPASAAPSSAPPQWRTPAAGGAAFFYDDPCEGGAAVDLRSLLVDDLFDDDHRVRTGDVAFMAPLCSPVRDDALRAVRVDLFPRNDTAAGADFSETPSRSLVMGLDPQGGARWELREGGGIVASGAAQIAGDRDARIAIRAEVPACEVAAASGGRCDDDRRLQGAPGGPLPPLALRACTGDVDCGPAYQTVGTTTTTDPEPTRNDVDYLPAPRSFQVTYPSICQGGAAAAGIATVPGARWAPLPPARPMPDRRQTAEDPDDPWWHDDGPGAPTGQWSLQRIGTTDAWDSTRGGGLRVAILDSGVDGLHPDLSGRVKAVRDFVPTRDGGPGGALARDGDSDLNGHGTFIASQIGARAGDATGMAGLAPDVSLLAARVFDAEGCASDAAIVDAIEWAVHSGAHAVNLSLGGPSESEQLRDVGRWATERGTVLVAAAGNSGVDAVDFPAGYAPYISVGATRFAAPDDPGEDPVAGYSNRNDSIELVAPGGSASGDTSEDLLGACWKSAADGRGWCRQAGTSFAAPLVAATTALIRAVQPGRTVEGVRELLHDTARDLTRPPAGPGRDDASGFGRLRTGHALDLLSGRVDTLDILTGSRDGTTASLAVSREIVRDGGADAAVIARRDVFADALAGAPLAGPDTPILLTGRDRLDDRVASELQRILPTGRRVWILGGTQALSEGIVQRIRDLGYAPRRLAGRTRIETANTVAREVGPGPGGQVLVASAAAWPDAIAGGLYASAHDVPLVLSWPDSADPQRSPGVLDTLRDLRASEVVLLGGSAALSIRVQADIEEALPGTTRRVAGSDRFATAAAVVTNLWGRTSGQTGDRFVAVNGQSGTGWSLALPAAPLAAAHDAPLLLVSDDFALAEPERLLRGTLAYRLDRAATATAIGPLSYSTDSRVDRRTPQRLRELLGG